MSTLTKLMLTATLLFVFANPGTSVGAEAGDTAPTAAQYREEAAALSQKAATHRSMGARYRNRGPGQDGYDMAKHCESLAEDYEKAAKDARAIAEALAKAAAATPR